MDKQNKRKELKKLLTALTLITVLLMSGCSNNDDDRTFIKKSISYEQYTTIDEFEKAIDEYLISEYGKNKRTDAAIEFLQFAAKDDCEHLDQFDIDKRKTVLACIQKGKCGDYTDILQEISYKYNKISDYVKQEQAWNENNIVKEFGSSMMTNIYLENVWQYISIEDDELASPLTNSPSLEEYEPYEFSYFDEDVLEEIRCIIYLPKETGELPYKEYSFDNLVYLDLIEVELRDGSYIRIPRYLAPTDDDRRAIAYKLNGEYEYSIQELNAIMELAKNGMNQ